MVQFLIIATLFLTTTINSKPEAQLAPTISNQADDNNQQKRRNNERAPESNPSMFSWEYWGYSAKPNPSSSLNSQTRTDEAMDEVKKLHQIKLAKIASHNKSTPALELFCNNVTQLKKQSPAAMQPIVGRNDEVAEVIKTLSDPARKSMILVGEIGVGKSIIIEEIARKIACGEVPENLRNKEIYALDFNLITSCTSFSEGVKERFDAILAETQTQDSVILFLDDIHMLMREDGHRTLSGIQSQLKALMKSGKISCICATTPKEYKNHIEKDDDFTKELKTVRILEAPINDTTEILQRRKEKYEQIYGIRITSRAFRSAANLAAQKIKNSNTFSPKRAIDLIEDTASGLKMNNFTHTYTLQEKINILEREIETLKTEKIYLTADDSLSPLQSEQLQEVEELLNAYEAKLQKIKIDQSNAPISPQELAHKSPLLKLLTHSDIATTIAQITGIKEEIKDPSIKLVDIEAALGASIIGQSQAVNAVARTIQKHYAGFSNPNKPIANFLFLGPTGVGKTELAKSAAKFLFGNEKKIIRIDMSEYGDYSSVNRLIGSPPGFIGYDEGGQLTNAAMNNPYAIILFDEIEKAHPSIFKVFLQLLDEGRLTDGKGITVDFTHTIIIMTSNLGAQEILQAPEINDELQQQLTKILAAKFTPEFINRLNKVIPFNKLTPSALQTITTNHISHQKNMMLEQRGLHITISDDVIQFITQKGCGQSIYGARPLDRAVETYITEAIAEFAAENPDIKNICITIENGKVTVKATTQDSIL